MANKKKKSSHNRAPRTAGRVVGSIFKWFFGIVGTLILMGMLTAAFVCCYGAVFVKDVIMPQTTVELESYNLGENSVLYYLNSNTGEYEELTTLQGTTSQIWVDYNDIPQYLLDAAVAIEDQRFYTHQGVDWKRTAGAVLGMLTGSDSYGGSTITQQLIKNLTENTDVTVKRKVTEIFQALEFEKNHSKSEILEYYLNIIYLGERCNGVGAAAQAYFGKDVSELDLAECAALIGITNNPSRYDPLLTTVMTVTDSDGNEVQMTHVEANKKRQTAILDKMEELGYITAEECAAAKAEELHFVDKNAESETEDTTDDTYSWFAEAVYYQVKEDLMDLGYSEDAAKLLMTSGGLSIYTTMDPAVQAAVDQVYEDTSNFDYTSANGQQLQSAITVVDNSTGAVVALCGGVGEKEGNLLYNMATMAKRQPGSSLKPLAAYAPALDLGILSPGSAVEDIPYSYNEEKDTSWPTNSYKYYNGLMPMSDAVMKSSNAAAVQVVNLVTPEVSFQFLQERFGITSLVESKVTTSGAVQTDIALAPLALGGLTSGVTTFEMAAAYATFARDGVYTEPYLYTQVVTADGTVLLENDGTGNQAIQSSTAYYMTQMLQKVVESGTGTAAALDNMPVAGKTGTTTNNYDRWFCGYTPYYTAAVWSGYERNEDISVTSNPSTATWKLVMEAIHENLPTKDFTVPGETVTVSYCQDSGKLPTSACRSDQRGSRVVTGTFLVGDEPTESCDVHTFVDVCTYSHISGTDAYRLAGSSISSSYTRSVSVLDIDRDVSNLHVSPRDEEYTLPWLMSFGYASYNSYVEDPEPEEPEEDNTTESPDDGSQDGDGTDPGGDNNTPPEPESPQEPASPDGGDTGTGATQ
jgi:penicillin-binding protein 1A